MDRAMRATEQWARERPDFDTRPIALLGSLAKAALVVPSDRLTPGLPSSAYNWESST